MFSKEKENVHVHLIPDSCYYKDSRKRTRVKEGKGKDLRDCVLFLTADSLNKLEKVFIKRVV